MHMRAVAPLLLLLFVFPFAAKSKTTPLEDAVKSAEANAATAEGKAYAAEVHKHFAEQHEISLKECTQTANEPQATPFQLVMRVGKRGIVDLVYARPETRVATCLKATVVNDHLKKPPKPAYWLIVDMTPKK
jgi:hypothetical protein